MKTHQQFASLFWLAIGVYVTVTAYRLGLGHVQKPGPGFIFFWTALLLVILSIIDLIASLRARSASYSKEGTIWAGKRWPKVVLVFSGLVVYTYVFNLLGFLFSSFLLMIFLFKGVEPMKWWASVLGSIVAMFIVYAVFQLWLKVPFPAGVLGF